MSSLAPCHRTFRAMGSEISICVEPPDGVGVAAERLDEVAAWFAAWERCLSRFAPDSELCALNRAAGTAARVGRTLWDALQAAVAAAEATAGRVTPTLLAELEAAGYDQSFELVRSRPPGSGPGSRTPPRPPGLDHRAIVFDESDLSVTLPPGMRLDLGGTAKGWAADRAAAWLSRFGAAQVNAGGDLAITGPRSGGRPWPVAVESPDSPGQRLGVLQVYRGGVATSTRAYRRWGRGGAWQHHLIDRETGLPAKTDVVSATVTGPSALAAEVAAKQVLLLGSARGLAWLETQPALAAVLVLDDGAVLESGRLAPRA